MNQSIQDLKQAAFQAIDENREAILEFGNSILAEPELGFKEFKTSAKIRKLFDELGIEHTDGVAITGSVARLKGKESKLSLAIMAELDAVVSPNHPNADPVTKAAHCCGHHAMMAALAGCAYALKKTGIMEELSGDIVLMAVPAEEYVEISYRNELRKEGKIQFLGGKQEFIRLGVLDDIDLTIMQHSAATEGETWMDVKATGGSGANGFLGQEVRYIGKEAHAGAMPEMGINALNAALIGLTAVNAQRETFRDDDHIRVHPIIVKGGDLVNVVPADVRIENYVRGGSVEAILDAEAKVSRAFKAGAFAVGADIDIIRTPGYLPMVLCDGLVDIMHENLKTIFGEGKTQRTGPYLGGSSDIGDVSHLMPALQASIGGVSGNLHSENYRMANPEYAYINAAKSLIATAIDLLGNEAVKAQEIKDSYQAPMTKEEYLKIWGAL